jgi:hypothetical protein
MKFRFLQTEKSETVYKLGEMKFLVIKIICRDENLVTHVVFQNGNLFLHLPSLGAVVMSNFSLLRDKLYQML